MALIVSWFVSRTASSRTNKKKELWGSLWLYAVGRKFNIIMWIVTTMHLHTMHTLETPAVEFRHVIRSQQMERHCAAVQGLQSDKVGVLLRLQ